MYKPLNPRRLSYLHLNSKMFKCIQSVFSIYLQIAPFHHILVICPWENACWEHIREAFGFEEIITIIKFKNNYPALTIGYGITILPTQKQPWLILIQRQNQRIVQWIAHTLDKITHPSGTFRSSGYLNQYISKNCKCSASVKPSTKTYFTHHLGIYHHL